MLANAPSWVPWLLVGNLLVVFAGLILLGGWVRRMFRQHVSDPLRNLKSSVDNLTSSDAALKTEIEAATKLAQRAHDRIDQILLGDSNA